MPESHGFQAKDERGSEIGTAGRSNTSQDELLDALAIARSRTGGRSPDTDLTHAGVTRASYALAAARAVAAQPHEGLLRLFEVLATRNERSLHPWPYEATAAGEEHVHALIGAPWPCEERTAFEQVWEAAVDELASRGLRVGRATFGNWDDADPGLGRLMWCLTRHLRPEQLVETGVARGLTTRILLEALERNGTGRLWSIDLPPLLEPKLELETAAAVPDRLRARWTLLRGSSRRMLPGLVSRLGHVDLFVHDSMHSTRNTRFELERIWPVLAAGGVAVVDDAEKNAGTGQFLESHPEAVSVIWPADDGETLVACLVKPGN